VRARRTGFAGRTQPRSHARWHADLPALRSLDGRGLPGRSILRTCVTAQWVVGTTRVTSNGQPLLVQSSQAVCTPAGTPLLVVVTQTRVTAI
jgi:hypothetical protein